jgi:hypothetical protein
MDMLACNDNISRNGGAKRELMIHAASTGCQCNDFDVGHKTERAG